MSRLTHAVTFLRRRARSTCSAPGTTGLYCTGVGGAGVVRAVVVGVLRPVVGGVWDCHAALGAACVATVLAWMLIGGAV